MRYKIDQPYVCPSCTYETHNKMNMKRHLLQNKKECQCISGITLNDEIKEHVLKHRVYHPPKHDKATSIINNNTQNNINIFNSLPLHNKIDAYLSYSNKELVDFSTKVDNLFEDLVKKLKSDDYIKPLIEWTENDFYQFMDMVCKVNEYALEDFNVYYDKSLSHIAIYDTYWETFIQNVGVAKAVETLVEYLLQYYEIYLIKRIIFGRNARMKQRCRELLEGYYAFLVTFNIKPFVHDKCNAYIIDDNKLNSYSISEEYEAVYAQVKSNLKITYKNNLVANVLGIIQNHTKANSNKLDTKLTPKKHDVCQHALTIYPDHFET
jgi:hypothetical protein